MLLFGSALARRMKTPIAGWDGVARSLLDVERVSYVRHSIRTIHKHVTSCFSFYVVLEEVSDDNNLSAVLFITQE